MKLTQVLGVVATLCLIQAESASQSEYRLERRSRGAFRGDMSSELRRRSKSGEKKDKGKKDKKGKKGKKGKKAKDGAAGGDAGGGITLE